MESKKINQLATELTPALSDLTIIGDPTTGISKKITLSQMASLFTGTVEEYPSFASLPLVGVADTIYITTDTNILYRWDTTLSAYAELSPNIVTSLVFSDANGFDGNISLVGSVATLTITTALTQGSVAFIGASGALSQDNDNFFWDDTNNRLGIGTKLPTTALDVFGSGIIGRVNGTSTNNAFLGFASAGTNKWSIGNVQSDHRFRIYSEANTSELVSVLQTGEFGIGIANPTTKLHIDGGASALIANLDANVSVAKSISFRSDNSNRINLEVSGTESGSNAGANFYLRAYSDAGSLLNTPLTILRSTGAATFISTVTASNGTLIGGAGTANYIPKFNATNAIENSVISQSGTYIGINVATPRESLEIAGLYGNIRIYGRGGVSNNVISSNLYYDGTNWLHDNTSYGAAQIVLSAQSGAILFGTTTATTGDATEKMRLLGSGNLGINVATPGATLPSGTGWTSQPTKVRVLQINSTDGNANAGVFIRQTDESTGLDLWSDNYFGDSYIDSRWNNAAGRIYFRLKTAVGGTPLTSLVLVANGLVGIGTTTIPNQNGGALAGSTIVNGIMRIQGSEGRYFTNGDGMEFSKGSIYSYNRDTSTYNNISINDSMIVRGGGNILMGNVTDSGYKLQVYGGGSYSMIISQSGGTASYPPLTIQHNVTSGTIMLTQYYTGSTDVGRITSNGSTITFSGNALSDNRYKEEIEPITNALDAINSVEWVKFKYKSNGFNSAGVTAQQLKESLLSNYVIDGTDEESYKAVDYNAIIGYLGKAVKELKLELDTLKSK
jgi:hypothetical protein